MYECYRFVHSFFRSVELHLFSSFGYRDFGLSIFQVENTDISAIMHSLLALVSCSGFAAAHCQLKEYIIDGTT